jgi:hypothetical protein
MNPPRRASFVFLLLLSRPSWSFFQKPSFDSPMRIGRTLSIRTALTGRVDDTVSQVGYGHGRSGMDLRSQPWYPEPQENSL